MGDPAAIAEITGLDRDYEAVIETAVELALTRWPALADSAAGVRATRDDLGATLRAVRSSVIVGDQEVLAAYISWFEAVLAARGLPLGFVPTGLWLLGEVLPPRYELLRTAAREAIALCSAPTMVG